MTKIYGHMSKSNSAKNKLEVAVHALLYSLNHIVIDWHEGPVLRESILQNVKRLNAEYPRCTAIIPKFWWIDHETLTVINFGDSFTYILREVRDFSGEANSLLPDTKGE